MAKLILDHSVRVQQSLAELTHRANQLNKQLDVLKTQLLVQLRQITYQLEKERRQPRKFLPFYDREKFYQLTQEYLTKFNRTLLRLFLEIRQFEQIVQNYRSAMTYLSEKEVHG